MRRIPGELAAPLLRPVTKRKGKVLGAQEPALAGVPRRTHRVRLWLLALAVSCCLTLTNQVWIGGMTIYPDNRVKERQQLHTAILSNRLPDGVKTWAALGANGLNIRILTVWSAEALHRATGQPLEQCYWAIETCALLTCCLLLFALLEACAGATIALSGLLYFGAILPLTYLFHYYHPWDKPSLAAWIAALICARQRRWVRLAVVLVIGVLIKYDIVVFPLLVLFSERRRMGLSKSASLTFALLALTGSVFVLLRWAFPGGFEPRPVLPQVLENLRVIREYSIQFPPFLALAIPATLAAIGFSRADDFAKAGVQLAAIVAAVFFLQVNFVEFRTEGQLLPLLLPASVFGVRRLLGPTGEGVAHAARGRPRKYSMRDRSSAASPRE